LIKFLNFEIQNFKSMDNTGKAVLAAAIAAISSELIEANEAKARLVTQELITVICKDEYHQKKNPHTPEEDNTAVYDRPKNMYNISAIPTTIKKTEVGFPTLATFLL